MALQDILQAITAEADSRVSAAQTAHKKRMKELKDAHEKDMADALTSVRQQKEARKRQMRSRAESQARMVLSHALLRRKRELLDELYDSVARDMAALPTAEQESLLSACLKSIKAKQGTVHPAAPHAALVKKLVGDSFDVGEPVNASGGFRFIGDKEDRDCTYDFLVRHVLRPETEIEVARKIFPSSEA